MKKIISFIVLFLLVSLITIVSFACDVPVEISVDPKLNLVNKDVTLTIGDEIDVTYTIENEKEGLEVKVEVDSDKVSVEGYKIKALAEGVANVSVYIVGYESIKANFKITVNKITPSATEEQVLTNQYISCTNQLPEPGAEKFKISILNQ